MDKEGYIEDGEYPHYYNSNDGEIVDIKKDVFIPVGTIYYMFKDYCEDMNKSGIYDEKFKDFLAYLNDDIYDWVKSNLHTFDWDEYKNTNKE